MANQINDGSVSTGSRELTIESVLYATDDFTIDPEEINEVERTDENDIPTGRKITKKKVSGSATLQLATEATELPEWGDQFTEPEGIFSVIGVGRTETKTGETKVPIRFVKNITEDIEVT